MWILSSWSTNQRHCVQYLKFFRALVSAPEIPPDDGCHWGRMKPSHSELSSEISHIWWLLWIKRESMAAYSKHSSYGGLCCWKKWSEDWDKNKNPSGDTKLLSDIINLFLCVLDLFLVSHWNLLSSIKEMYKIQVVPIWNCIL